MGNIISSFIPGIGLAVLLASIRWAAASFKAPSPVPVPVRVERRRGQ